MCVTLMECLDGLALLLASPCLCFMLLLRGEIVILLGQIAIRMVECVDLGIGLIE